MLYLYTTLTSFLTDTTKEIQRRAQAIRSRPDAGLGTLEMVILGLGLFTLAGIVVAVITTAVTSRTVLIK
jgi:peptide subunit release factor RF-3